MEAVESERKRRGRPAYAPTEKERSQVRMLAGMGLRQHEIASVIGVAQSTLRKHFWQELELGQLQTTLAVAQSLFKMATDTKHPKAVTACIFWLKARAGWRDSDLPGKRAQAEALAEIAENGTDWEGLLQ